MRRVSAPVPVGGWCGPAVARGVRCWSARPAARTWPFGSAVTLAAIRPAFMLPVVAQAPDLDLAASAGAADTAPASTGTRANPRMMRTGRDVMLPHLTWIDVRPLCVTGQVLQR